MTQLKGKPMLTRDMTIQFPGFAMQTEAKSTTPLASLVLAVVAVFAFKIFLAVQMGPELFQMLAGDLAQGDLAQRVAGHLLVLDTFSEQAARILAPWLG